MREILIARAGGGPEKPKDRRFLGLAALAALLFAVALGVRASRLPPLRAPPKGPSGEFGARPPAVPAAPSPPSPEPPMAQVEAPRRELSVSQFLGVLARETPKGAGGRFISAFARRPALRQAIVEFKKTHDDNAPAQELVHALFAQPEFGKLLAEFRSDPDFAPTFKQIARNAEVNRILRGSFAQARSGAPTQAGAASSGSAATADKPGDDAAPDAPPRDEAGPNGGPAPGAHEVQARLSAIKSKVGERSARKFVLSALASMPKEYLQELDEACKLYDDYCDPVQGCQVTGLWDACVKACRKSGKCPRELMEGEEPGASAR